MNQNQNPRNINLSGARGTTQRPAQRSSAQRPSGYGQAAGTQRNAAASGQVNRTAQPRAAAGQQAQQAAGQAGQRRPVRTNAAVQNEAYVRQRQAAARQQQMQRAAAGSRQGTHTAQRGTSQRSTSQRSAAASRTRQGASRGTARRKSKNTTLHKALTAFCIVCVVFLGGYIALRAFASSIINTGEIGTTKKTLQTPPQYQGEQLNVLLLGIDYGTDDAQDRSEIGMTDMIMYVRFNFVDNTIRMLQIPRDTFVGAEGTGGTGKINALFANGADTQNRVNNIAQVLYDQYNLPVDNYVSIDMDSLREIVDLFGGIDVFVPMDMEYNGSYIPQGMQHLDGASAEFFLRNRKQFATSDIQRLANQRYFYSALFRLIRTSPWTEIVKLTPVVRMYINTDIDAFDCAALGIRMLKIPSSQILICRLPVAGGAELYNGQAVVVADPVATAELLDEYFNGTDTPITAASLNTAEYATAGGVHASDPQWMSDVDTDGGVPAGEAADATQTGDDLLAQAESIQTNGTSEDVVISTLAPKE